MATANTPASKAADATAQATNAAANVADATAKAAQENAARVQESIAANTETITKAINEQVEKLSELNSLYADSLKKAGNQGLDIYEQNVALFLEAQNKLAQAIKVPGFEGIVSAQVELVKSVSQAQTSMARELLK
ncbi:phasin family protein [Granulicoccus phenolivorans]|uniref:phasin family protein n=1 Tax=Granulicoccus phenolivorans TaxID=266854 RepID=UPI000404AD48|nr:phasin family protein [Granulicoccus phenolivorans]